jgi:beta-glucosidase
VETFHTLVDQVKQKKVPESAIDDAVRRLLREKFELGLFEDPYVDPARADEISGSAESRKLALEAARQAIVLLQNRGGLLPLHAGQARRVAVVGPHAAEVMLGGYSGVPRHSVSILEGVRQRLGADVTVRHAEGVRITEDSTFTRGPQPLVGGVGHLDQQPEGAVRVLVEPGLECLQVELADLRGQLGELRVPRQLRPPGGPGRGLALPRLRFLLIRG